MSFFFIDELNGITAGTAAASKALVLDSSTNISGIGTVGCGAITSSGDMSIYDDQNNADTTISIGTASAESLNIQVLNGAANKTAEEIKFVSKTASGTPNHGKFTFHVDEAEILEINDDGINVTGTITGDTSLTLDTTTITTAEIGVLDSVTPGTATASKALVLDSSKDIGTIRNLTIDGTFTDGNYTFDTDGNVSGLGTVACGAITTSGNLAVTGTITGETSLTLDTTTITTAEIGVLESVTPGTAAASKALVLDSNKDIGTIRNLTIDGTFTDGNYTFDTDGNVSGLGTVGCGAITTSGNITISNLSNLLAAAYVDADDGVLISDDKVVKRMSKSEFTTAMGVVTTATANVFTAKQQIDLAAADFTVSDSGHHLHIEGGVSMNDTTTNASSTALEDYKQVAIETVTLTATNSSVTTTNASTLYIDNAPTASTNQTITNAYSLNVNSGTSRFGGNVNLGGIMIYDIQTITFGDNGGDITATTSNGTPSAPTKSIVYLNSSATTNTTYHWDLSAAGTAGQLLHLFYNEVANGSLELQINFGSERLVSGSGPNDNLTLNTIGQSATLIYVESKWRIINTGGTVG